MNQLRKAVEDQREFYIRALERSGYYEDINGRKPSDMPVSELKMIYDNLRSVERH
ncbi:hypothetical protein [Thalassobacillus sp. CUG 92003]|uniref:hypothetical protein n=1 Tax=Thalassobacillus sp. CUG 92003 TaxID=2736641 RepID=UPI0015E78245|nr:hypothetical protein [Thalassobacillus sp. CUG 92003]